MNNFYYGKITHQEIYDRTLNLVEKSNLDKISCYKNVYKLTKDILCDKFKFEPLYVKALVSNSGFLNSWLDSLELIDENIMIEIKGMILNVWEENIENVVGFEKMYDYDDDEYEHLELKMKKIIWQFP